MFSFSFFVFGRLSTYHEHVTAARLDELIEWAIENEWSYSVAMV